MKKAWIGFGILMLGCAALTTFSDEFPWSVKPPSKDPLPATVLVVLDDFESGTTRWTQRGDGSIGVQVTPIDNAPQGKRAAELRFYGNRKEKSWMNIFWYIDGGGWPADGRFVTFWAKASAPCTIMPNLHEGPPKMQNEFFGVNVELTTEWKQYRIPFDDFKIKIWGHKEGNGKLDIDRTILFGINQRFDQPHLTFPVTIQIDAIYIEKE